MSPVCFDGGQHRAIVTLADDPDIYDATVLGPTPNDHQFGYCEACLQAFEWSVEDQYWKEWHPSIRHSHGGHPHSHASALAGHRHLADSVFRLPMDDGFRSS